MKKFIAGILVGILLVSLVPVYSAVQEYILQASDCKLMIDGNKLDSELPMLNLEGYNYLPAAAFRDICAKLNIGFDFDNVTKEIQITTSKKEPEKIKEETVVPKNNKAPYLQPELYRGHKVYSNAEYAEKRTEDGVDIYILDDVEYVSSQEIEKIGLYHFWYYNEANDTDHIDIHDSQENLLKKDIPFIRAYTLKYSVYIEYDYYIKEILPLAN